MTTAESAPDSYFVAQANAAIAAKDWPKAFTELQRAIAIASRDASLVSLAALVCMNQRDARAALPFAEAWDLLNSSAEAKATLYDVYYRLQRHEDALTIAQQIVELDSGNAGAWFRLANALSTFDMKKAAEAFAHSFTLDPTCTIAISNWFYLSFSHLTNAEMTAVLESMAAAPNLPAAGECMIMRFLAGLREAAIRKLGNDHEGIEWSELGFTVALTEHARWRKAAAAWFAVDPNAMNAAENFILASLADQTLKDLGPAVEIVRKNAPDNVIASYITSPDDLATLDESGLTEALRVLPETVLVGESFGDADRAFFCGCDQAYFDRYGPVLIGSFFQHAPDLALHIHVVNPDEARLRHVLETARGTRPIRLRITTETIDPAVIGVPEYTHAVRFIRFAQFMGAYRDQFRIIDADSICLRDPSWLCERLAAGGGVAVMLQPARIECHNQIAAGLIGIGRSAEARRYAALVAGYIGRLVATKTLNWGCDQAALYLAFIYLRGIAAAPGVTPIPRRAMWKTADVTFQLGKFEGDSRTEAENAAIARAALQTIGMA